MNYRIEDSDRATAAVWAQRMLAPTSAGPVSVTWYFLDSRLAPDAVAAGDVIHLRSRTPTAAPWLGFANKDQRFLEVSRQTEWMRIEPLLAS